MTRPIFTQAEADSLIAARKIAPYESQIYEVTTFQLAGTKIREFQVEAEVPFADVDLRVQVGSNPMAGAFSVSLLARMPERRQEGLCRYDVHDNPHPHRTKICPGPPLIDVGQFHVHRYTEAVIRAGFNWDHCADVLEMPDASFSVQVRDLIGAFVKGVNLHFSDTGSVESLFKLGRQ